MLMLYLGVIDEIPKFREAYKQLKVKTGSWFPYSKAICHSEALLVAPIAFGSLPLQPCIAHGKQSPQ